MRGLAFRNVPTVLAFCSPYRAPWSPSMRTKTARRGPKRVGLLFFCVDELVTDLTYLSDDSIRRSYEHIRDELMADAKSGGTYRFMGAAAKTGRICCSPRFAGAGSMSLRSIGWIETGLRSDLGTLEPPPLSKIVKSPAALLAPPSVLACDARRPLPAAPGFRDPTGGFQAPYSGFPLRTPRSCGNIWQPVD